MAHDAAIDGRSILFNNPMAGLFRGLWEFGPHRLGRRVRSLAARVARVIRVDALWLSVAPLDMRAGMDTLLAQVVQVFGEARPHHAYLFANRRGTRMKVLIHDGQGIWS